MKKIVLATTLAGTLLLAQESTYKYEITPMLAGTYTEGNLNLDRNYANAGLGFGINLEECIFDQVELGFLTSLGDVDYDNSTQNTNISRFFTNVVKEYPLGEKNALYALVGIGYEHFSNAQFRNEDGLFANYGFGYKYKFTDDMALKMDLRHLIEDDHGDNNLLYTVGLAFAFGQKGQSAPMDGDDDNDGVLNSVDQCPQTPANTIVNDKGCAVVIDLHINFNSDKATIKEEYNSKLEDFAKTLKAHPEFKTTLSAHTDSVGDETYNQNLSDARAKSAKEALVNLGIDPERISTMGYGESKPIATNDTAEGRAKNRRVEATLTK